MFSKVRRTGCAMNPAGILDPRALLFCACLASSSSSFLKPADAVKRGLWGRECSAGKKIRPDRHSSVVASFEILARLLRKYLYNTKTLKHGQQTLR